MTRQLASRQVEGEAAIDRPASLVHAVARCRSGGSAPGFCQRLCQTLWQNQAGTPGPTGAELASGRISAGGVCSPMVGVAAQPEPGRASAWARFRAAPSAVCTSHPVELLAQVVCCLICHVVRRHWARSPVQRAVSRLWIVPADRRSRECSKRQRTARRLSVLAAAGRRAVSFKLTSPQATAHPRLHGPVAHAGRHRQRAACPWSTRRLPSPKVRVAAVGGVLSRTERQIRRLLRASGANRTTRGRRWSAGVSDCVSLSVLRPTIHTEPPGGDALVSVIRNTQNALVLARPPRPA
jgi:hypothetical protein